MASQAPAGTLRYTGTSDSTPEFAPLGPGRALRVLLLNYEFPPLGGGAGIASAALAQRLAARGVIVDVVTSRPSRVRDAERIEGLSCTTAAPNLTLFRVWSSRRGVHQAGFVGAGSYLCSAMPVARRLLRARDYDIVHIYFSLPTGALIPALPLGATPVVVSLRGSDVPGYDERNAMLVLAHRVLKPLTRWIWHRVARVRSPFPGMRARRGGTAARPACGARSECASSIASHVAGTRFCSSTSSPMCRSFRSPLASALHHSPAGTGRRFWS